MSDTNDITVVSVRVSRKATLVVGPGNYFSAEAEMIAETRDDEDVDDVARKLSERCRLIVREALDPAVASGRVSAVAVERLGGLPVVDAPAPSHGSDGDGSD
jgi:hypothetical protein